MEYAILDELYFKSEERKADYQMATNKFFVSRLEEVEEPFPGSSDTMKFYIFQNYVSPTGLMNLAIIIRETPTGKKSEGGLQINNVETAIFPLYNTSENAFDLPPMEELPDIHPDTVKFIVSKRTLPKKPVGAAPGPQYKWTINEIAKELHISNRTIAQYCRVKNI